MQGHPYGPDGQDSVQAGKEGSATTALREFIPAARAHVVYRGGGSQITKVRSAPRASQARASTARRGESLRDHPIVTGGEVIGPSRLPRLKQEVPDKKEKGFLNPGSSYRREGIGVCVCARACVRSEGERSASSPDVE